MGPIRPRSSKGCAASRASAIPCTSPSTRARILELADERGVSGPHVALARSFHEAVGLTMNVSMPIGAVLLDLGYPAAFVKAIPILARTASLLAHLAEEQEHPIGFDLARAAEEAVEYRDD
jgi:citrate synthase